MHFEWDEAKNRENLRKHGFDFVDAAELFTGDWPFLVAVDENQREERWLGIGMIHTHIVVAVFTEPRENVIRIISLRKANREEQSRYEQAIKNELGSD